MISSDTFYFLRAFATIDGRNNLCPKHMKERMSMFDNWHDRNFDICYRIVVDNERCYKCRELAESAYYSRLMEERKN